LSRSLVSNVCTRLVPDVAPFSSTFSSDVAVVAHAAVFSRSLPPGLYNSIGEPSVDSPLTNARLPSVSVRNTAGRERNASAKPLPQRNARRSRDGGLEFEHSELACHRGAIRERSRT
jgi:hypothetical protein